MMEISKEAYEALILVFHKSKQYLGDETPSNEVYYELVEAVEKADQALIDAA